MNNYKIRVNNEAESREAQELFFELGYKWFISGKFSSHLNAKFIFAKDDGRLQYETSNEVAFNEEEHQELTLPQLRDLVVLHRNNIDDANWVTEGDDQIYQDSTGKSFIFRGKGWDELQRHEMRQAMWEKTKSKPQAPKNEQGLISGADAKLAWAKGENVQFRDEFDKWYQDWTDLEGKKNGFWITDFDLPHHQFRIKPTLTVNAELPKPHKETQQNTEVYAVTYEFKTREERNAFADKLRGTNS
ncbi:hypothetical protein R5L37_01270 [Acinetobacter pittii]|uniref:hypothetical protein n=1 Tax=Acinetobacter pittii TaxID=48296 RepID=UPI002955AEC8|nr:hypothetical protein [Acinetobacter pittii]MDV8150396.1 hypothetical protein [Acinetobacter pittii]